MVERVDPRLGAGVRRQHDRVVAPRELQIVVQPDEDLPVLDVHETAHDLLDLLADLVDEAVHLGILTSETTRRPARPRGCRAGTTPLAAANDSCPAAGSTFASRS